MVRSEVGETKEQALIRECREELNVDLSVGDVFMDVVHEYPDITVHLTLFNATIAAGVPQKLEHNDIQWIAPGQIPNYAFCSEDEEMLVKICEFHNRKQESVLPKKQFVFIEYNDIAYPLGYESLIKEVAGHLDKEVLGKTDMYSLHTEYSYGKRNLNSEFISKYPELQNANKNGIPQLWKSLQWADEFAQFVIELIADNSNPEIIEIHPPFNDYVDLEQFVEYFRSFERIISNRFPNTKIFIENRSGALYRGGKFLVENASEIAVLCNKIQDEKLNLGVVLDFPQLLTAERIDTLNFNYEKYYKAIETIYPYRYFIKGLHIWGKKKNSKGRWIAHCGNLDTYFEGNSESKKVFIDGIARICDDGMVRFFVPEVNSGADDLAQVVTDLFGSDK